MAGSKSLAVRTLFAFSLALLAFSLLWACHRITETPASRCFLVDLQQKEGARALPKLDEFASSHGLVASKSDPIAPRFQLLDHGRLVAEVSYTMGMGEFGANLAFFSYDPSRTGDLLESFDSFIDNDLSIAFPTRRCSDVPGYENPIVYR